MAGIAATVSSVGAGVSQVRFQDHDRPVQLKEQDRPSGDMGSAALHLIQSALRVPGTIGRDLDVLA